jgi:hypothetical protein
MTDMTDGNYVSVADYCARTGRSERTVRRWISEGRLPSTMIDGARLVPADARPGRPAPAEDHLMSYPDIVAAVMPGRTRTREVAVTHPTEPAFWFTVDDVVGMWAPLVSRHAVVAMIHAGELQAVPRGRNGGWLIPAAELRRIAGV